MLERTHNYGYGQQQPSRKTSVLVARELDKLQVDITAVSKVRYADQGSLVEQGAGHTLFRSGKAKEERRLSCVGFMIKTPVARTLHSLPVGHSDRLMSLRLFLLNDKFAILIRVYAPTLQGDSAAKDASYRDLHDLLRKINPKDKLIILGVLNSRMGSASELWRGALGK